MRPDTEIVCLRELVQQHATERDEARAALRALQAERDGVASALDDLAPAPGESLADAVSALRTRLCEVRGEIEGKGGWRERVEQANLATRVQFEVAKAFREEAETAEAARDRAREALREMVAAHDAERAAARAAAKVRHEAFKNMPPQPKRMPRNAVIVSSLSPDEEQRLAAEMAPIEEAEQAHALARERAASALAAARTALREG